MARVEIELEIAQTPEEVEDLLIKQGFTINYKVRTIANYYSNQQFSPLGLDLKAKSVRIRTSVKLGNTKKNKNKFSVRNSGLINKKGTLGQNELTFSYAKAKKLEQKLIDKNFELILTDDKTDFVYFHPDFENTKIAFQIQNIKGLGVIVAYDNALYENMQEDEQRKKLIEDVKQFGIKVKSEKQVNRYERLLENPTRIFIGGNKTIENEV